MAVENLETIQQLERYLSRIVTLLEENSKKELLSIEAAAYLLNTTPGNLYNLIADPTCNIPYRKPKGLKVTFLRSELLEWVIKHGNQKTYIEQQAESFRTTVEPSPRPIRKPQASSNNIEGRKPHQRRKKRL